MTMSRMELAKKCQKIEKAGGDVLEYLRTEQGCYSPWGTWFGLQKHELRRKANQITDGRAHPDEIRKETKTMPLTDEQKRAAIDYALDGGNPLIYLKSIAAPNPGVSWAQIMRELFLTDRETFDRLPDTPGKKKAAKKLTASQDKQEQASAPKDEEPPIQEEKRPEVAILRQTDAEDDPEPEEEEILKPVMIGGCEVTTLRMGTFGEIHYDSRHGFIDWYTDTGDVVSLHVGEWRKFLRQLPEVAKNLGVRL